MDFSNFNSNLPPAFRANQQGNCLSVICKNTISITNLLPWQPHRVDISSFLFPDPVVRCVIDSLYCFNWPVKTFCWITLKTKRHRILHGITRISLVYSFLRFDISLEPVSTLVKWFLLLIIITNFMETAVEGFLTSSIFFKSHSK